MDKIDLAYREALGFQEAVLHHMSFLLLTGYEFHCVYSDPYCVKFESEKVYVNVFHERHSYEVYLELGLLPNHFGNVNRANLVDILKEAGHNESGNFYAITKMAVDKVVGRIAQLLRTHGREALVGDAEFYRRVTRKNEVVRRTQLQSEQLERVELIADEAWRRKNFEEVIRIYEPYVDKLNPIQRKRLQYARKKVVDS